MTDTEDMSDDNSPYTYTYDKSYDDNSYNPTNYNKKKEIKEPEFESPNETEMKTQNELKPEKPKKKVNQKATLDGIIERQQKIKQLKEKHKKKVNEKLSGGIYLLYNIMKQQNTKLLKEVQEQFEDNLPFECDLESDFMKPSYIVPKIVSHRLERHLNKC